MLVPNKAHGAREAAKAPFQSYLLALLSSSASSSVLCTMYRRIIIQQFFFCFKIGSTSSPDQSVLAITIHNYRDVDMIVFSSLSVYA